MSVSYAKGVLNATIAAGPLFLCSLLRAGALGSPPLESIAALPIALAFLLAPAILIGGCISALPNLLGASLLAALGQSMGWARHPLIWVLSGAVLGALLGGLLDAPLGHWYEAVEATPSFAIVMAVVGAACALICRWGTRWQD